MKKYYVVLHCEGSLKMENVTVLESGIEGTLSIEMAVEKYRKAEPDEKRRAGIQYVSHNEFTNLFGVAPSLFNQGKEVKECKQITVVVCDGAITNVSGIPEGIELKIIDADWDAPSVIIFKADGSEEHREATDEEAAEYLGEEEENTEEEEE